jgi:NAD-dependent deacetylase
MPKSAASAAHSAPRLVVLTGSGVSAESGVPTFRDKNGVWAKYDYRQVATPEGFAANPALVHEFYNSRRRNLQNVAPNPAHFALAELEAALGERGGELLLVTQNVDNLHERAGSKNLLHMHGELAKVRCENCGAVSASADDLSSETACAACRVRGAMRPHVVWFGEMPLHLGKITDAIAQASGFVSIGTSGSVYPAAGFVSEARAYGIPCTELNLEPSENASLFTDRAYGPAGDIVPKWARAILTSEAFSR